MAGENEVAFPGWGYSFESGELTVGDEIFTAFTSVSSSQPTSEEVGMGASPFPLTRSEGAMELGSFSIEWSDIGERNRCIAALAAKHPEKKYRMVLFGLTYVMTVKDGSRPPQHYELKQCRLLDEPDEASQGSLIGGQMEGSFMKKLINGLSPH